MNALLQQFIQESREFLEGIAAKLMALERAPGDGALMNDLFRHVHTLKGNSGLFEFPQMTRVLHAGEDLMDAVRDGRVAYSESLADRLLDAMDFLGTLIDEIEATGAIEGTHTARAESLAQALRALMPDATGAMKPAAAEAPATTASDLAALLAGVPERALIAAWQCAVAGDTVVHVRYRPEEECFFKGEDPFHQARQTPGLLWGALCPRAPWPQPMEFDCYRCTLDFVMLATGERPALDEHFRYVPEQVATTTIAADALVVVAGGPPTTRPDVRAALACLAAHDWAGVRSALAATLESAEPHAWTSSALRWALAALDVSPVPGSRVQALLDATTRDAPPTFTAPRTSTPPTAAPVATAGHADVDAALDVLRAQADALAACCTDEGLLGHLESVGTAIAAAHAYVGRPAPGLQDAVAQARAEAAPGPLVSWLEACLASPAWQAVTADDSGAAAPALAAAAPEASSAQERASDAGPRDPEEARFGRRAEDALGSKVLKVDQVRIDRLMNLIGEMVVAKNALPYLANRAEHQYGVRELSREIKAQYGVINRIAEEMQDAIMQVRMMPVSFVFQRFPRLVRDLSRRLGKDVELVLEGEETEADKNIVEALADPLIHIVRNSLDHGLELPDVRVAAGKPRTGHLTIRARQESDSAVIEVSDDGRGIDPAVIRRKAYEKGLIDEAALERLSDDEAVNLVFRPGFSTAETVSDLSGRGVGMDVVRNAIDKVGGTIALSSRVGEGTTIRLSLPLSMAITNVMIVESDRQIFGVPMTQVVETVRLPRTDVRTIKTSKTVVLRDRLVPLRALNDLLAVNAEPVPNADDELATLVVKTDGGQVGILVDDFREVVDVILKPLPGELAKIGGYAGTALLGDGSVLMVLNPRELV